MPQLNLDTREITLKIVYYGPAMSGKTTNLLQLHAMLAESVRGNMVTLDTQEDRTLYFDFLPVEFGSEADFRTKIKLFTVPGQVLHRSTRKIVLAGVDGVVFVSDSQRSAASGNAYSYRDLEMNIRGNGIDFETLPKVVQFNKRDLEDTKPLEEIREAWQGTGIPTVPAVALKGEGVIETFQAVLELLYHTINRRHDFAKQFGVTEQAFLDGILRHLNEPKPDVEDPSE